MHGEMDAALRSAEMDAALLRLAQKKQTQRAERSRRRPVPPADPARARARARGDDARQGRWWLPESAVLAAQSRASAAKPLAKESLHIEGLDSYSHAEWPLSAKSHQFYQKAALRIETARMLHSIEARTATKAEVDLQVARLDRLQQALVASGGCERDFSRDVASRPRHFFPPGGLAAAAAAAAGSAATAASPAAAAGSGGGGRYEDEDEDEDEDCIPNEALFPSARRQHGASIAHIKRVQRDLPSGPLQGPLAAGVHSLG